MSTPVKTCRCHGMPINVAAWTIDDWRDLHETIEAFRRRVAERYAKRGEIDRRGLELHGVEYQ